MSNDQDLKQLSAQIEDLAQRVELIADPAIRANVTTLLQALMDLHAKGFARITDILYQEGEVGDRVIEKLSNDELVGGLLLLYGLHPGTLESRVGNAIKKAQDHLLSSGGSVQLLHVNDGVVRLRVTTDGNGCGTAAKIDSTIEDFIYSAAPDVVKIEIERRTLPKLHGETLVQLQLNPVAGTS